MLLKRGDNIMQIYITEQVYMLINCIKHAHDVKVHFIENIILKHGQGK